MFLNLGAGNCIVDAGRCFSPLTKPPSLFCTVFLPFNGETNLVTSLEGEKDRRNFDAADLFGELLLKHINPSLFCTVFLLFDGVAASLEGEKCRLNFDLFGGELNLVVGLIGDEIEDTTNGGVFTLT